MPLITICAQYLMSDWRFILVPIHNEAQQKTLGLEKKSLYIQCHAGRCFMNKGLDPKKAFKCQL